MARVLYGPGITEFIGSVGGMTFQKNTSGTIVRLKPSTPVNPSLQQSERQLALIQLVAMWGTLSLANKNLWNALAAAHSKINDWGNFTRISGYQWFLSYNLNAYTQGDSPWLFPDAYLLAPPVPQFTLSASALYLKINWTVPVSFPGYYAGIYATTPMRQTSIKLRKATFLILVWHTTNVSSIDITALYEAYFNIVWADFYATSQCAIIVRMKNFLEDTGYASSFTSNIIQIG